jgi:acyl carrier protein
MSDAALLAVLRRCLVDVLRVEPEVLTVDTRFEDDLGADSLDLIEALLAVEEELGMTIDQRELEGVRTVGDALALLRSKVS